MMKCFSTLSIILILLCLSFCKNKSKSNDIDNKSGSLASEVNMTSEKKLPHILVTDVGNRRLVGFDDLDGNNWVEYYGNISKGISFRTLGGIAVDSENRIYISDYTYEKGEKSRIIRIDDMSGKNVVTYEDPDYPIGGLCIDSKNRIYYHNKKRIVRIDDITGKNRVTLTIPNEDFSSGDIKITKDEWIYFTNFKFGTLYRVKNMEGEGLERLHPFKDDIGPDGKPLPKYTGLATIAISPDGKIFSTSWFRSLVLAFDNMQDDTPVFCDINTQLCDFRRPSGIAIDSKNRVYVAEFDGSRILRMDDVLGNNMVTFGEPGIGKGQFEKLHVIWTNL